MNIEILTIGAALFVGEVVASLIGRYLFSLKNQLKLGEELMAAINKARQDVIQANKLIEEMERVNHNLRKENQELTADKMRLENLVSQLKSQLNNALDDIDFWQQEVKKSFPNWPDKGTKN